MYNVERWSNIFSKSCDVKTARFSKYVWPLSTLCMKGLNSWMLYELSKIVNVNTEEINKFAETSKGWSPNFASNIKRI